MNTKPIKLSSAFFMFLLPGIWFYIIIKILVPVSAELTGISNYIVWLILGTLLLNVPLFLYTIFLTKREGYITFKAIIERLKVKNITFRDILWIVKSVIAAAVLTGVIILAYSKISAAFDINSLRDISPIAVVPLVGTQRIFLVFLPVFFFFNYVGEEVLWRGYILPRQLVSRYSKYACIINAIMHCVYHLAFGIKPLVLMIPFMILMPYIAYKRDNTTASIIVHFLIGAPAQTLIALGYMM